MTVKDTEQMIAGMTPVLTEGLWVYCDVTDWDTAMPLARDAFAIMQEAEGLTLILPAQIAAAQGYGASAPMRLITLDVYSDLEGVGLTAAVAGALTAHNISCNVVAAYHHDHIFVPERDAHAALAALQHAQSTAASAPNP